MERRLLIAGVALIAAGCAAHFERAMNEDLNQFVGKDIHVAISELGYPGREETIAGDHIFRWGMNMGSASMGSSTGIFGTGAFGMSKTKATGCLVDLVVDNGNVVTRASWSGSKSSCEDLEGRLWEKMHSSLNAPGGVISDRLLSLTPAARETSTQRDT
jgi:hypothetical protein